MEDLSKPSPSNDAIMINVDVYIKLVVNPYKWQQSRDYRKCWGGKKLLDEVGRKLIYLITISFDIERHEAAKCSKV